MFLDRVLQNAHNFYKLANYRLIFKSAQDFSKAKSIESELDDGALINVKDELADSIISNIVETYTALNDELNYIISGIKSYESAYSELNKQPKSKIEELYLSLKKDKVESMFTDSDKTSFNRSKQNIKDVLLPDFLSALDKVNNQQVYTSLILEDHDEDSSFNLEGFNKLIEDMETDIEEKCNYLKINTKDISINVFNEIQNEFKQFEGYDDKGKGKALAPISDEELEVAKERKEKDRQTYYAKMKSREDKELARLDKVIEDAKKNNDFRRVESYEASKKKILDRRNHFYEYRKDYAAKNLATWRKKHIYLSPEGTRSFEGIIERFSQVIDSTKSDRKKQLLGEILKDLGEIINIAPELGNIADERKKVLDDLTALKLNKTPENSNKILELEKTALELGKILKSKVKEKVNLKLSELTEAEVSDFRKFETAVLKAKKNNQLSVNNLADLISQGKTLLDISKGSMKTRLNDLVNELQKISDSSIEPFGSKE